MCMLVSPRYCGYVWGTYRGRVTDCDDRNDYCEQWLLNSFRYNHSVNRGSWKWRGESIPDNKTITVEEVWTGALHRSSSDHATALSFIFIFGVQIMSTCVDLADFALRRITGLDEGPVLWRWNASPRVTFYSSHRNSGHSAPICVWCKPCGSEAGKDSCRDKAGCEEGYLGEVILEWERMVI